MKWFTKRPQLISNDNMYPALSKVLIDFVDKIKTEGKLKLWYTSLKNNDGKPSFRVYFQIEDKDEKYVQSEFETFMKQNQTELGWTGKFIEPDPNVPDSIQRLQEVNKACELVLSITKQFPQPNRRQDKQFVNELKSRTNQLLHSVPQEHHREFIHFIANNLAVVDDLIRGSLPI